jgi:hypothetical protein
MSDVIAEDMQVIDGKKERVIVNESVSIVNSKTKCSKMFFLF